MDEAPSAVAIPADPLSAESEAGSHPPPHDAVPVPPPGPARFSGRDGFVTFYEEQFAPLVRLGTLLTGSPEVASDLVQDSFVQLHRRWAGIDNPLAYVRRCLVNAATSHHRRAAVAGRHLAVMRPATSELEPDELFDALAALPARQRAALVLRFYDDLDDREIAATLRCRPATVRSLVHRGLGELRKVVEP